jgi:hypothetical protein
MSTTRPPAYDERFATPIDASRRGAHRARPKPVSAGLPVLAGIAVVLVVIGGVYTVLGGNHKSDQGAAVSTVAPSASASATPSAATSGISKATATTPAASTASSTGSAGSSASSSGGTGTVDHSVSLKVLNSVGVSGLAKKVTDNLEPDGWTVSGTGNSINRNLVTTKVYYGSSSLKATAQAMVQDLGYGTTVKDASVAPTGLVVVLGQDSE